MPNFLTDGWISNPSEEGKGGKKQSMKEMQPQYERIAV